MVLNPFFSLRADDATLMTGVDLCRLYTVYGGLTFLAGWVKVVGLSYIWSDIR